jgi:hypothetical protein
MAGTEAGSGSFVFGHSEWIIAASVGVIPAGSIPQAARVQYGAPEPPEKRDHWFFVSERQHVWRFKTHHVLVRIHENLEAMVLAFAENANGIIHEIIIILSSKYDLSVYRV